VPCPTSNLAQPPGLPAPPPDPATRPAALPTAPPGRPAAKIRSTSAHCPP